MNVPSSNIIYSFNPEIKPAAHTESGSIITFETMDCFGNQIKSADQPVESLDWDQVNPATGPVHINGALPGNTLQVSILKIELDKQGVMAAIPGYGVLGDRVTTPELKIIPIKENVAYFNDLPLSIKPMVGVIGIAPREGEFPCGTPGAHGGNLDTNMVCAGNDILLPVHIPGALLAMGDVHALMGDGEVWVTGIETAARVWVQVKVLKHFSVQEPVIINNEVVAFLSSAPTLDEAVVKATEYAVDSLVKLGLSFNEAGMLLSATGDLQVSQVVDPQKTARMVVPRWILSKQGLEIS